ncbi:septation protein SpoVG family protein [Candidatus Omnitrophota bacterium]
MEDNKLDFKIGRLHRLEADGALKAFADLIVNDALLIKGLRVIEGKNGIFVSMPKQQGKDKKWYDTIHPVTRETEDEISSVILRAFQEQ